MKYIFVNDLFYLTKKSKKIILIYFIIIVAYAVLISANSQEFHISGILDSLGLKMNYFETENIASFILFLIHIGFSCYLSTLLFAKDIQYGLDNIFLRIKNLKFIIYKWISILLLIILSNSIIYFIVMAIFEFSYFSIYEYLIMFCKKMIYLMIIQSFLLTLYSLSKYIKFIFIPLIIGIFIFINKLPIVIIDIDFISLMVSLFMSFGILLITYRKLYIKVFEGGNLK